MFVLFFSTFVSEGEQSVGVVQHDDQIIRTAKNLRSSRLDYRFDSWLTGTPLSNTSAGTPAFSWTRSFEFFSFLPFLEKEKKKHLMIFWSAFHMFGGESLCTKCRNFHEWWWLLLSGIFASTFSSFGNKQRMVFDIILLGVQNPADTVSAPQSNSFIMLWFPFYFNFFGSVLCLSKHWHPVSRLWSSCPSSAT